jgi:serine phosphatase RsbU (regulator of sigma subunit)
VAIEPDETLFLYTDGVTDTRGESERFGVARLRRVLSEHGQATPGRLLAGLERALEQFQRETHSDDTAALALRPAVRGSEVVHTGGANTRTLRAT